MFLSYNKQLYSQTKIVLEKIVLRAVYNTDRPLNRIVKDATATHDLSNVVYIWKFYCGNDYVSRTSQRFHVSREQHVTKKLKIFFFFITTLSQKVNNYRSLNTFLIVLVVYYLDSRFKILSSARNSYHRSVLESLLIRIRELKVVNNENSIA